MRKPKSINSYCGVYAIQLVDSKKIYLGSTARSFHERLKKHRLDLQSGRHHSQKLQRAWDKYGVQSFVFRPLLICDGKDSLFYEQRAMDQYAKTHTLYNTSPVAGSVRGVRYIDNPNVTVIEFEGEKHTLYSLADKFGVCRSRLKGRLVAGWELEDALLCDTDEIPEYRQAAMQEKHTKVTRDKSKKYMYLGNEYIISELSALVGVPPNVLAMRLEAGWSLERTMTTPSHGRKYPRPKVKLEDRIERFEFRGEMLTCGQLAELCGYHPRTVRRRIKLGWTAEDAVTKPLREWP